MNCVEARALVEDALDGSLAGMCKRSLALHLSRCEACRDFFAADFSSMHVTQPLVI